MPDRAYEDALRTREELSAEGFEFCYLDSDDIDDAVAQEMIELFRASLGGWPRTEVGVSALDHLRWKIGGPNRSKVAFQGRLHGELVFAATSVRSWFRIGGVRRFSRRSADLSVKPEYQRQKIYSRSLPVIIHLLRVPSDISIGESGRVKAVRPLWQNRLLRTSTGQRYLGNRVQAWYRILRPVRFAAAWLGRSRLPRSARVAALAPAKAWGSARSAGAGKGLTCEI